MKKFNAIFFMSLCTVCCTQAMGNNVWAAADSTTSAAASIEREIRIIATTVNTPLLRSAPAPAVSAWLSDAQLDLTFLSYLGMVTITVANEQETVYTATVAADDGTEWAITTQGWSAGDYTITIVRSNGQSFTGEFEL